MPSWHAKTSQEPSKLQWNSWFSPPFSFLPPFSLRDVVEKRGRRQLWQSWESQQFPGSDKEQGKKSLPGRVRAALIFLEAWKSDFLIIWFEECDSCFPASWKCCKVWSVLQVLWDASQWVFVLWFFPLSCFPEDELSQSAPSKCLCCIQ